LLRSDSITLEEEEHEAGFSLGILVVVVGHFLEYLLEDVDYFQEYVSLALCVEYLFEAFLVLLFD
jgi:hypothetical protein